MRSVFIRFTILLISTVISGLLSETVLRILGYAPHRAAGKLYYRGYFCPDPVNGYDICPNAPQKQVRIEGNRMYTLWSNELGCFDRPYRGEKRYILLVGDSFTHGAMSFSRKWGTLIEQRLGIRTLKCGVLGYGTRQEWVKARRMIQRIRIAPRWIIVGYYVNDLQDDYLYPGMTVVRGWLVRTRMVHDMRSGAVQTYARAFIESQLRRIERYGHVCDDTTTVGRFKCWLGRHSALYEATRQAMRAFLYRWARLRDRLIDWGWLQPPPVEWAYIHPHTYSWLQNAWMQHLQNILQFRTLAGTLHSRLVFVLFPAREQVDPSLRVPTHLPVDYMQPQRIVRRFLQERGIAYIDLLPVFRAYLLRHAGTVNGTATLLYHRVDVHLNERGESLVAETIIRFLQQHGV